MGFDRAKTLFVSDLDGTLLDKNALLSEYSAGVLQRLIAGGYNFTAATARIPESVLWRFDNAGVKPELPLVLKSGAIGFSAIDKSVIWVIKLREDAADKLWQIGREKYGFTHVVGFGDNMNDLPLFSECDECCAPENAVPEVKAAATGIIGACENDGVARWLEANVLR